jgi:hypothetical protein
MKTIEAQSPIHIGKAGEELSLVTRASDGLLDGMLKVGAKP